ncbi:MAG: ABC transporter ATP-binding protein, partial [Candidatus Njordarchaeia archaeon]
MVDLWFRYNKHQDFILKNLTYQFTSGKIYCILGPIGCGKTTLLLLLSGLINPLKGRIEINGVKASKIDRRLIGISFQNPDDQLFNVTVRDELEYSLKQLSSVTNGKIGKIIRELDLGNLMDKKTMELSFGQKKMLSLASILVYEPKILQKKCAEKATEFIRWMNPRKFKQGAAGRGERGGR